MSENSLYNKYRPKTFSEVVGQDIVISILKNQVEKNNIPHSMIFHGDFGTGKTSVARIIANELNDTGFGLIEQDCTIEFLLDDARRLQNTVDQFPMEGTNKVYIFDEAHNIPNKAFDGLLKVVEEPPEHVYFIFITSNFSKIPKGIVSRSSDYEFKLINQSDMRQLLGSIAKKENIPLSDYALSALVQKAQGSARAGLVALGKLQEVDLNTLNNDNILEILGIADISCFENFVKASLFKDFAGLMGAVETINGKNIEVANTVSLLQKFVIDLRFNLVNPEPRGETTDLVSFLKEKNINVKTTGRYLDFLYDELVKAYKDIIHLPFPDYRMRRLVIEIVKTWQ